MVIPMLICSDAAAEIEFCKSAFSASELSRRTGQLGEVVHATLKFGETMLMVHGEYPHLRSQAPKRDGSSPVVIYLYVEDVDTVISRAVKAGAEVLLPAANQVWGDRVGRIIDSAGHVWNVAAHISGAIA
jgi:PhnB protein